MVGFSIKGHVEITLKRKQSIIKRIILDNLITNKGLDTFAKALIIPAGAALSLGNAFIGVGTDEGIPPIPFPQPTDLTLANELPDIKVPRKQVQVGGLYTENNVAIFEVEFMPDEGNPNTGFNLVEAGLFWDGATLSRDTGVLVARVLVTPVLPKNPAYDALGIKWTYEIKRES